MPDLPRPLTHLHDLSARYPNAWKQLEAMRADRGKNLPGWPEWCYVPLAAAYAVALGGRRLGPDDLSQVSDVAALGTLGAWRMTKSVYRFDPDILTELWLTPPTGDLPGDLLLRLPEWCVYIETGGREVIGTPLHGFYGHLESDANDGRRELRLLLDSGAGLVPLAIHLVGTVEQGLEQMTREAELQAALHGRDVASLRAQLGTTAETNRRLAKEVAPLVSLLLYLCSEQPDIGGVGQPKNPQPKRVKGGERLFASPSVRTWDVAFRLGAAYRRSRSAERAEDDTTATGRQRPRGHMRAAHWHTFLTGPRSGPRVSVLHWLPPITVNLDEEPPAVVKRVKGTQT